VFGRVWVIRVSCGYFSIWPNPCGFEVFGFWLR
jgi:hypothetical protein